MPIPEHEPQQKPERKSELANKWKAVSILAGVALGAFIPIYTIRQVVSSDESIFKRNLCPVLDTTLASWNTEGQLRPVGEKTQTDSAQEIGKEILNIDSDIIVLSEATILEHIDLELITLLRSQYSTIVETPYNDENGVSNDALLVLSKRKLENVQAHHPEGIERGFISFEINNIKNNRIRIFGVHLPSYSDAQRTKTARWINQYTSENPMPTVVTGDLNSMPPDSLRTKILRLLLDNQFAHLIAKVAPENLEEQILQTTEMTRGSALRTFESAGFVNANNSHKPTVSIKNTTSGLPDIELFSIDHALSTDEILSNFNVIPTTYSDHSMIEACLETN
jgi:endonuclease/exonuclease/phosphatase family metal-dependent hydrolase